MARDRLLSLRGLTRISSPSRSTVTSSVMATFCSPSLPLAVSRPAAIVTSTPLGIPTGFLPTRDILEHPAEDFAADILGARLGIGHDAARRRQDGDRSEEHKSELQSLIRTS